MNLTTPFSVQKLQTALRDKAKESPNLRFHALYDKVYRKDVLAFAYECCKANGGAAGVDGQTFGGIEEYGAERWLDELAEELRNRTYRPLPVRRVYIPKPDGKQRPLGVPTIRDRTVETAAVLVLDPIFEADLQPEQYAYRKDRSALDAVKHVHKLINTGHGGIVDADLSGYFDNIPQDLLIRAVKKHAKERWMVLYIERWLKAPVQEEDGQLVPREKGTPQGGVISPLLANLFLHYVFDRWMAKRHPQLPFERFADDAIVHCRTENEAQEVRAAIAARMRECGLELHPEKTKIVYCKDDDRRGTYPNEKFDFLGYTFRPRRSKSRKGKYFINFSPAVSDKAAKAIRAEIGSWDLHLRSDKRLEALSRMFNPIIRGWLQYYGRFYRSALYPPMRQLDRSLARWAERKYKKLRGHLRRATHWVARISRRDPKLWAHWQLGVRRGSMAGAV